MAEHPEPSTINVGSNIRWLKTISTFQIDELTTISPIADGYALTYALRGVDGVINLTATTSGDDYLVSVLAATTATWTAGRYAWQAYLTKLTSRYLVDQGSIELLPNFATASTGDTRSHDQIMYDAISAALEQRATSTMLSYAYAGKSISKMSHAELQAAQIVYIVKLRNVDRKSLAAAGLDTGRNTYVRFTHA